MGRRKKINASIEQDFTPTNENISDIFKNMENEENIDNPRPKRKYVKKKNLINLSHEEMQKNNDITKAKLETIEAFYKLYPHLKKEKKIIINKLFDKNKNENEKEDVKKNVDEHTFDKFTLEGQNYYRDKNGAFVNDDNKLMGIYHKNGTKYTYIFHQS